ncbi:hypothetical protein [Nocardioides iriomotensis]|uniref:DUF4304 domain-containing protein n=1 Tax=Nocardioides iriomotensis TaxID=715784 RepID=A0A4Q5IW21_9ACTN|nr:hypothetical protein [Nocardioides iriomotensis]RYU10290.1 hypothetical protein ETU37_18080 [Nocardioides iriomotensis]
MTMPQVFDGLVREHVAPALKQRGLRKKGRATWWERRSSGGWVLLALRNDKWNSADEVQFWAEAVGWPPGTWELVGEILGVDPARQPYVAANAPIALDLRIPDAGAGPARPEDAWLLTAGVDPAAVAVEVTAWFDEALRRLRADVDDPDEAVRRLVDTDRARVWEHVHALATMQAAGPGHPRFVEVVERLTERWAADPRPITLRPFVERWRAEAGLPPVDLPTFWTPSMLPHTRERFATPQDAYRAGIGRDFHYADGTSSTEPPPGWLGAAPPAAPARRRRWLLARWSRRGGAEESGQSRHGTGAEP